MEGINVLCGIDSHYNLVFIKVLGKRELAKYAVYLIVFVELVNERVKLLLRSLCGKLVGFGIKAYLVASTLFISYVNLRCGILAYDYYRKTGTYSCFFTKSSVSALISFLIVADISLPLINVAIFIFLTVVCIFLCFLCFFGL